jgi:hypothetical protein
MQTSRFQSGEAIRHSKSVFGVQLNTRVLDSTAGVRFDVENAVQTLRKLYDGISLLLNRNAQPCIFSLKKWPGLLAWIPFENAALGARIAPWAQEGHKGNAVIAAFAFAIPRPLRIEAEPGALQGHTRLFGAHPMKSGKGHGRTSDGRFFSKRP